MANTRKRVRNKVYIYTDAITDLANILASVSHAIRSVVKIFEP